LEIALWFSFFVLNASVCFLLLATFLVFSSPLFVPKINSSKGLLPQARKKPPTACQFFSVYFACAYWKTLRNLLNSERTWTSLKMNELHFKVAKLSADDHIYTNKVYASPLDFNEQQVKYVIL
jgi:hypothetical protein